MSSITPITSKNLWPFSPQSIPGCQLWLDANDQFTITLSGSSITAWNDKSGNGYSAIPKTPTSSPGLTTSTLNGKNTIFLGSNELDISSFNNGSEITVFFVFRCDTNGAPLLYYFSNGSSFYYISMNNAYLFNMNNKYALHDSASAFGASFIGLSWNILCLGYKGGLLNNYTINGYTRSVTYDYNDGTSPTLPGSGTLYINIQARDSMDFAEIIHYNSTLTTNQRQQVEGYLAQKWGLQNNLPTSNIISVPLYQRVFQPVDIPGCQLWLDAADQQSLTLSGTSVTAWNDKSGNGNNATASGTPVYTSNSINGYSSIYLNNSPYFTGSVTINGTSLTCFALATTVATLPLSGHDQRLVSLESGSNVDYGRTDGTIALFNQSTTSTIATWRVSGPVANNTIVQNVPFLAVSQYDGTNGYLWFNGSPGSKASDSSSGTFAITKYGIGNQANPSGEYWYGYIGEVIIYNSALSNIQRQQVEQYLAWKWGLKSSLSSVHPGSRLPAFISTFNPKTISGLQVWFDGLDPNANGTIPSDGSSISTWYDKSGNSYNATNGSYTAPTYSTTGFNGGYPGVLFNGSSTLLATPSIAPTPVLSANGTDTSVFVVMNRVPTSSVYGVFGLGGAPVAGNYNSYVLRDPWSSTSVSILDFDGSLNGRINVSNNSSGPQLYSLGRTGSNVFFYRSGSLFASNSSAVNSIPTTSQPLNIGGGYADSIFFNSYISEFIVYNVSLTTSQRQQVEGYLAWKWGLQSSLSTNHAYKKFKP